MDWKYPRGKARKFAESNGPEKVEMISRAAFAATDASEAVQILCRLHGVWVAMASAILTSYDPLRYTVIDVRAWNALEQLDLIEPLGLSGLGKRLDYAETYAAYLQACTILADNAGVSLRSLDRCLWTLDASRSVMNQTGLYGWARDGVTLAPIVKSSRVEVEQRHDARPSDHVIPELSSLDQYRGCLLGGAVGDALGAAVEFDSLAKIRSKFGPGGIRDYAPAYGRRGAITDDTQMTLFTAEGLIRADNRYREKGIVSVPGMVHRAYVRWLFTQGQTQPNPDLLTRDGWLIGLAALHSHRAPGGTCLSALASGTMGTVREHINGSKGCGGIMRVAPVGLAASAAATGGRAGSAGADPFTLGCDLAAITHGHPSGYLAAGFFADLIARIVRGEQIRDAVDAATAVLREWPDHAECLEAVEAAVRLAESGPPSAENVERLGEGWVAEESLAIALYCALTATSFEEAVVLAVNHGGDSDSTGSIVGNILGALRGASVIPARWLAGLELRDEIEQVATDLFRHFGGPALSTDDARAPDDGDRYPGW